jgi:hypothetical protein
VLHKFTKFTRCLNDDVNGKIDLLYDRGGVCRDLQNHVNADQSAFRAPPAEELVTALSIVTSPRFYDNNGIIASVKLS